MSGITREDWLQALGSAAQPPDPDALTVVELAEMTGMHIRTAYVHAKRLVREGKAVTVVKFNGTRRVPAYKLVKDAPHPATRRR